MISVSPYLIIAFYVASIISLILSHQKQGFLQSGDLQKNNNQSNNTPKSNHLFLELTFWVTLLIGIILHFSYAASVSYIQHSFNFSVASMSFWISVLVVSAFAVGSLIYPIKNLAVIVLPLAVLSIIFALIWGDQQQLIDQRNSIFYWHISTAVSAFTLLSLSVLQSLLFGYQELSLRKRTKNSFLTWLPPIQTMEHVLFKTIVLGFILLSIAITLGSIYNYESNQTMFTLNHHTVLAVMSWISFAILLYGRIKLGWRGLQAINWTLIGFALMSLGYFGTKIISEMLIR